MKELIGKEKKLESIISKRRIRIGKFQYLKQILTCCSLVVLFLAPMYVLAFQSHNNELHPTVKDCSNLLFVDNAIDMPCFFGIT